MNNKIAVLAAGDELTIVLARTGRHAGDCRHPLAQQAHRVRPTQIHRGRRGGDEGAGRGVDHAGCYQGSEATVTGPRTSALCCECGLYVQ